MKTLLLILGGAYILRRLMHKNPTGLLGDAISMMIINFDNRDENGRVECKTTYTNGSTAGYCFCEEGFLYQLIKDTFERGADCVSIIKNGEPKNYYSLKELYPFDYFSTTTDLQIQPTLPGGDKRRKL